MAITANVAVVVKMPLEGDEFFTSAYSADASGAEDVIAAVTGKSHYVRKIQIHTQSVTDLTVTLGSGQGTGVTVIALGPLPMPDAGGVTTIDFGADHALKIVAGATFAVDTSAAAPISILVWAKTAD